MQQIELDLREDYSFYYPSTRVKKDRQSITS